jgi:DNA-binding response OmpR family regulator
MNILVIEDEKITRELIVNLLKNEYTVFEASNATDAFNCFEKNNIDMLILDVILPGDNGYNICTKIRENQDKYGVPFILILSSKNETEDLIEGLNRGADDYLKKPFDNRELISRVSALFRRKIGFSKIYRYENLTIDTEKMIIKMDDTLIELSKKEYELILYMIINKGIVLSRKKLLEKIWNLEFYEGNRTVDTYIKQIRKKIPILNEKLVSIRGFGYKII